jgi:hypothetical protein
LRSINVEANLLETWAVQRNELEHKIRQRIAALVILCMTGAIAIPSIASVYSSTRTGANTVRIELAGVQKQRIALGNEAQSVTPSIKFDEMSERCQNNTQMVMNELADVVNSAPLDIVFSAMKIELMSGECTIKVTADATSAEVGRMFVEEAGKGKSVTDSMQTAVRKSATFGDTGVTFDYVKEFKVER